MQPQLSAVAAKQSNLREREVQLRANLQKLLVASFILIASLLLLQLVPFFPAQVSVLASFGLAALAYRSPAPATGLMLLLSVFGYVYQLGLPIQIVAGMVIIFSVVSFFCGRPGTAMGTATGAIAAMLMLTPVYYLSLPVFVGIAIFRARGQKVGSTTSLLVFLALFLPLLTNNLSATSPGGVVPLFQRASFNLEAPLSFVEIGSIFSALGSHIHRNSTMIQEFGIYLPIDPTDISSSRLLGIVLIALIGIGISVAFGGLALSRWLAQRVGGRYLPMITPVASLVIADAAFLVPLEMLKTSFSYSTGLDAVAVAGMLGGAVLVGGVGSAAEQWLKHRDQQISLAQELSNLLPSIEEHKNGLKTRLESAKAKCQKLNLSSELALVVKCEQELSFASSVEHMDIATLQQKLQLFKDFETQFSRAFQESLRKLSQYYSEGRLRFNDYLRQSAEMGLASGEPIEETTSAAYEGFLFLEDKLNERLAELARRLMEQCGSIFGVVTSEIDGSIMTGGVEIARNYLTQGNYEDAVDTLLTVLAGIGRNLQRPVAGLSTRIEQATVGLKSTLSSMVVPMLYSTGDDKGVADLNGVISQLESLRYNGGHEKTFASLTRVVSQGNNLSEQSRAVVSWMATKLTGLEKEIEGRVPPTYSWGKSAYVQSETDELLGHLGGGTGKQKLENRVAAVERANQVIQNRALIIRQYTSTLEFLINYVNIEYLLDRILQEKERVEDKDLPVRSAYALQYLKLYSQKRYRDVVFDAREEILRPRREDER